MKLHSENSVLVRAPCEKVFAVIADVTSVPKWSTTITSVRQTRRDGNVVYTDTEGKFGGRTFKNKEKHVFTPPGRYEAEGEGNAAKTKTVMTLDAVPEGTRIFWVSDVEVKGVFASLFGSLAKGQMKKIFDDELNAFAKYVESTR